MKYVLKVILAVCLLAVAGLVQGQSVPVELQGFYAGTGKLTQYESGQPVKMKYSVSLFVEATQWTLTVTPEGGSSPQTFVGTAAAVPPYLFGRASYSSIATFGGRLQVKGKAPLKHSLAGTMSLAYGDFWGVGDLMLKAKKVPL